ncbi:MAG: phosphoribosylformylglycinamidine cyclo-ligase [Candidatus Aminicenantia bacterium]
MKKTITYKEAGVDIDKAVEAKKRIKKIVERFSIGTEGGIGSFGAFFPISNKKILVSSVDGVGTKLKIAFLTGIHNTIGKDLVNHCVNDILVQGAKPLFFMDYIALSSMNPDLVEKIVEGIAEGCKENNCELAGGETAEMPGFYNPGEYDLVGFITGIVERKNLITGKEIKSKDIIFGLPSTGLHTNGYSLARKIIFEKNRFKVDTFVKEFNCTVGEELLKIHKSYLKALEGILNKKLLKGLVHITGGGFYDNIPRVITKGLKAVIKEGSWEIPPVFKYLVREANLSKEEAYRTFNMGIGMIGISDENSCRKIFSHFEKIGEKYYIIGEIKKGEGVEIK